MAVLLLESGSATLLESGSNLLLEGDTTLVADPYPITLAVRATGHTASLRESRRTLTARDRHA